jgi:cyclopropane-fatty-acyl-phospholipid synthase
MDLVQAARALFSGPSRQFAVRLWDGTVLPPERPPGPEGAVVLASPRALDAFLPPVTERGLSEAFLDGDLEFEGDAVALLAAAMRWDGPPASPGLLPAVLTVAVRRALARLGRKDIDARLRGRSHSLGRDRQAIEHHYDVSDDFYRLFLDDDMVYSCAYFAPWARSLEDAQQAKLDLVCRKLALSPGDRLLDVGCGWGALVARAVEGYGARAVGVTLSRNQLEKARRRVAAGPPGGSILALDYRQLPAGERFDKISSVGMMEHVGRARLPEYFATLHRLLEPGGLFLNHYIADTSRGQAALHFGSRRGGTFIERYIFPDGELIPLPEVLAAAEHAGFEVRDVDSLREHYADTCAAWLSRLEERWDEAVQLVGTRRARAYRLYLASSSAQFRLGGISIFQVLLARPAEAGQVRGVPRWRGEWYERAQVPAAARVPEPAPWAANEASDATA